MKKYFILDFKIPIPIRHTATVMLVSFIVVSSTGMYANYNHVDYPISFWHVSYFLCFQWGVAELGKKGNRGEII